MSQPTAYLTAAEATAIIASELLSTDPARTTFAALSDDDKAVMIRQATIDHDAVAWDGARAECQQQLAWPRVDRVTREYIGYDPDATGNESVPHLPRDFRSSVAMQAAHLAMRSAGLDPNAYLEDAAKQGMTAPGGMALDLMRATNPWARLCARSQRLTVRFRFRGGAIV